MQNVKICLFPSFVGELIAQGTIQPTDLSDCEKLTAILSEYSVNKIKYLNTGEHTSSSINPVSDQAIKVFNLDILNDYVANNSFMRDVKTSVPFYTAGPTLAALSQVGDEAMVPALTKALHNFALPFKTYRLKPKLYGVVFEPLHEVSSPCERVSIYSKDMESLVSEISLELSDSELLGEDIYQHYLSLN